MATINYASWKEEVSVTPYAGAIPHIVADPSSFQATPVTLRYLGTVSQGGSNYEMQCTIYGRFNYSSQGSLLQSSLTGVTVSSPTLGSCYAEGFNSVVSDFLQTPTAVAQKMLQGQDQIIGTAYGDVLDGYLGNDDINGGAGADRIYGGAGKDCITGGAGSDSFYTETSAAGYWTYRPAVGDSVWLTERRTAKIKGKKRTVTYSYVDNDYDVIRDFNIAEDTIYTRGGTVNDVHTYLTNTDSGILIFDRDTHNAMAVLYGMKEDQFMTVNNQAW
jgi:Ca2+-binding RTX toxin-like protein